LFLLVVIITVFQKKTLMNENQADVLINLAHKFQIDVATIQNIKEEEGLRVMLSSTFSLVQIQNVQSKKLAQH
jgi:formylmethanofuran dehydrogenase subunit D